MSKAELKKNDTGRFFSLEPEHELKKPGEQGGSTDTQQLISSQHGPSQHGELLSDLHSLSQFIANLSEAYSAVIFIREDLISNSHRTRSLKVAGFHTLSRDFIADARISFGSGLVGWAAERGNRIAVSPFEHDATSLKYYSRDQQLKSFAAYPIISEEGEVLGVIACDSKKSYAFSQVTEKLLFSCTEQAERLISLHHRLQSNKQKGSEVKQDLLADTIERIRNCETEQDLMTLTAHLPDEVIARDALVVVTAQDAGIGGGVYAAKGSMHRSSHRLLTMVCEHKKVICSERSVHALPTDDIKQRSFLSIPFHTLNKEAGSFNLLSKPHETFNIEQISNLEKISAVVGRELERIRLKEHCGGSLGSQGMLSWQHFSSLGKNLLDEAKRKRQSLSLVRMSLRNIRDYEELGGVELALHSMQKIQRLVEQVKRAPAIACYLYGTEMVVLCDSEEVEPFIRRMCNLVERLSFAEMGRRPILTSEELGDVVLRGIQFIIAKAPRDGESVSELLAHSLRLAKSASEGGDVERKENGKDARTWL